MSDKEIHALLVHIRQRERNAEYEKDARVDIPEVKDAYQEYKENL